MAMADKKAKEKRKREKYEQSDTKVQKTEDSLPIIESGSHLQGAASIDTIPQREVDIRGRGRNHIKMALGDAENSERLSLALEKVIDNMTDAKTYLRSISDMCIKLRKLNNISSVASRYSSAEEFAATFTKEPTTTEVAQTAKAAALQDCMVHELNKEANPIGGVCAKCSKQILPEWGECYTHWGPACEKDNCCTCTPGTPSPVKPSVAIKQPRKAPSHDSDSPVAGWYSSALF